MSLRHLYKDLAELGCYPDLEDVKPNYNNKCYMITYNHKTGVSTAYVRRYVKGVCDYSVHLVGGTIGIFKKNVTYNSCHIYSEYGYTQDDMMLIFHNIRKIHHEEDAINILNNK